MLSDTERTAILNPTTPFWKVRKLIEGVLRDNCSLLTEIRQNSFYGSVIPLEDAAGILAGIIKGPAQK